MNSVSFSKGTSCHTKIIFNQTETLEVEKKETTELTYKLGILYIGLNEEGKHDYIITINKQTPSLDGRGAIHFPAIKKISVKPDGANTLKATEIDENGESTDVWFVLHYGRWKVVQSQPIFR